MVLCPGAPERYWAPEDTFVFFYKSLNHFKIIWCYVENIHGFINNLYCMLELDKYIIRLGSFIMNMTKEKSEQD